MKVAITGGTGFIGRFIVEDLLARGREAIVLGRNAPPIGFFTRPVPFLQYDLRRERDVADAFTGVDAIVHAAFEHVPGRYRGGEGDDPEGFRRANLDGTLRLFGAAKAAGARRCVFLSSRAVLGDGESEGPDTLYGEMKHEAEQALASMRTPSFAGLSLRLTGVYGPGGAGRDHKWSGLFRDYLAGLPVAPRAGTELHGRDAAAAAVILLSGAADDRPVWEASDILVDRRDLLDIVRKLTDSGYPLPERADASGLRHLDASPLRALGWSPGGWPLLERTVADLLENDRGPG